MIQKRSLPAPIDFINFPAMDREAEGDSKLKIIMLKNDFYIIGSFRPQTIHSALKPINYQLDLTSSFVSYQTWTSTDIWCFTPGQIYNQDIKGQSQIIGGRVDTDSTEECQWKFTHF